MGTRIDSLVVSTSDCGTEGPRFESHRHLKNFLSKKIGNFSNVGSGGEFPWLTMQAVVEEANPLESLKVGYWGPITTDNRSLRDRVYGSESYYYEMFETYACPEDRRLRQRKNLEDLFTLA